MQAGSKFDHAPVKGGLAGRCAEDDHERLRPSPGAAGACSIRAPPWTGWPISVSRRARSRAWGRPSAASGSMSRAAWSFPASSTSTPTSIGAAPRSGSTPTPWRAGREPRPGSIPAPPVRATCPGFRSHVIERLDTRVLVFLHVSFAGIFGFSREVMVGEVLGPAAARARRLCSCRARASRSGARHQGACRPAYQRPARPAAPAAGAGGGRARRVAADVPHRRAAAATGGRPGPAAAGRRAHPLLPTGAQLARSPGRQRARGCAGGARARRGLRHRPRHGLLRLRHRRGDAGPGLRTRRDQLGRARLVHRRAGIRQSGHHVQVSGPGHVAGGDRPRGHGDTGTAPAPPRSRQSGAGRHRRRHGADDRGRHGSRPPT